MQFVPRVVGAATTKNAWACCVHTALSSWHVPCPVPLSSSVWSRMARRRQCPNHSTLKQADPRCQSRFEHAACCLLLRLKVLEKGVWRGLDVVATRTCAQAATALVHSACRRGELQCCVLVSLTAAHAAEEFAMALSARLRHAACRLSAPVAHRATAAPATTSAAEHRAAASWPATHGYATRARRTSTLPASTARRRFASAAAPAVGHAGQPLRPVSFSAPLSAAEWMDTQPLAELKRRWDSDGYVVIEGLLSEREVDVYHDLVNSFFSGDIDTSAHRHDLGEAAAAAPRVQCGRDPCHEVSHNARPHVRLPPAQALLQAPTRLRSWRRRRISLRSCGHLSMPT